MSARRVASSTSYSASICCTLSLIHIFSALAKERGIWLVGGTVPELAEDRIYNTCYVFAPDGQMVAKHRKMHLFDIDVKGGQRFMESETLTAGDSVTTFDTPWGRVGVCVCFDFRFTELSELMVLSGAKLIVVPAAFNMTTGPAHWELLFRQRAVAGQCYTCLLYTSGAGFYPARQLRKHLRSPRGRDRVIHPYARLPYLLMRRGVVTPPYEVLSMVCRAA